MTTTGIDLRSTTHRRTFRLALDGRQDAIGLIARASVSASPISAIWQVGQQLELASRRY